jgi:acetyl esterase/lipase
MKLYKISFCIILFTSIFSCQKNIDTASSTSVAAKTMLNVSYGTSSEQTMDIYLPANRTNAATKVLIMIHGGAWNSGDKTDLTEYVDTMRRRLVDYAVFNINYRLAVGSNLFPAQENDVKNAVQFILNNAADYGISQKFVLLGVSAGAHLALLQGYKYSTQINPKAIISFFAPTDLIDMYNHPLNAFIVPGLVSVIGKTPAQDSLIYATSSPINFVKNTSSPTIILQGGTDPLVSVTQATRLKAKLDAAGVINQYVFYPNEGHGWLGAPLSDSFDKIQAFLNAHVN